MAVSFWWRLKNGGMKLLVYAQPFRAFFLLACIDSGIQPASSPLRGLKRPVRRDYSSAVTVMAGGWGEEVFCIGHSGGSFVSLAGLIKPAHGNRAGQGTAGGGADFVAGIA